MFSLIPFLRLICIISSVNHSVITDAFADNETLLENYRTTGPDRSSRKIDLPKRKDLLSDREIVDNLLRNYRFPDSSDNVTVAVHISIDRILNDMEHECNFWLTIRQKWVEKRLIYEKERPNGAHIRLRSSSYIWNPLITISNALEIRMIGKEEVELHSNGMVELTQKLLVKTMEIHELHSFPFDERNCSLIFHNEDSRAQWTGITSITVSKLGWGIWIVLGCERIGKTIILSLRRSIMIWIWTLYAPTTILFFCSWLSLWAASNSAKHRFVITTTSFFTILIIAISNKWNVTRTSYLKAIDIWNLQIIAFAFFIVLQSVFMTKKVVEKQKTSKRIYNFGDECNEKTQWFNEMPYYAHLPERQPAALIKIVDYIFRIILPIIFLIICTVYFIHYTYLNKS
ncbi:Neurotransmitter-gated ion-channel ligand binding domain family protein [Brugia pahangi]